MIALGLFGLVAAYVFLWSGFKGTDPRDEILAALKGGQASPKLKTQAATTSVPVAQIGQGQTKVPVGPTSYAIGCDMACHRSKNAGRYDNWESNNAVDVTPVPNTGTGTPVRAPIDGRITVSGWDSAGGWRLHIAGFYDELYLAHFAGYAPGIGYGREVKKGQVIAYMGSTGDSGSPHVHLSSRNGNPTAYLEGLF